MYYADFRVQRFASNSAWSYDEYKFSRPDVEIVREDVLDFARGSMIDEARDIRACAPGPFEVTITTRAGEGNASLDGERRSIVAAVAAE